MKESLKVKTDNAKQPNRMSVSHIKSDRIINFYTGIQSLEIFNTIFDIFEAIFAKVSVLEGNKNYHLNKSKDYCVQNNFPLKVMLQGSVLSYVPNGTISQNNLKLTGFPIQY